MKHCIVLLQDDWNEYGVEWNGLIPNHNENFDEANTVVIEEFENILSPQEMSDLEGELSRLNPNQALSEEVLIEQFVTAKIFMHSV